MNEWTLVSALENPKRSIRSSNFTLTMKATESQILSVWGGSNMDHLDSDTVILYVKENWGSRK